MFMDPEEYGAVFGKYLKDGVETDIRFVFPHLNVFRILDAGLNPNRGESFDQAYYYGRFKIKNNQIVYTIDRRWHDRTDVRRIIFKKVGEYEIPEIPYGEWKSEGPNITLFIDPEHETAYRGRFPATFSEDDENIDLFMTITDIHRRLRLFAPLDGESGRVIEFFFGYYRIVDDKIYYTPPRNEHRGTRWDFDVDVIIFERVK